MSGPWHKTFNILLIIVTGLTAVNVLALTGAPRKEIRILQFVPNYKIASPVFLISHLQLSDGSTGQLPAFPQHVSKSLESTLS
ncbi:hypothetical protein C8R48DRAFT_680735 [Suillus tomentosus]|nr:hypothetical protein C8R48DRAFT_680735 [Suillus tomentosus]